MFKRMSSFLVLGLSLVLGASVNAADLKIGFVNVPKVLETAPQAERAKKDLEKEFSPRDKQIVSAQKEVRGLEEKLQRDAAVMAENERRKLERDILNKKRELQRSQDEFREDFNIRRNEELGKLQRKVFEAIKDLAKQEKYDMLLTDGVIYASDAVDVTAKVEEKLKSIK